ncbi:chaperone of endosialidase [Synechococcus phage S-CRES1]|nr:chaperone of endosialidase [Synechococcus phage S-CRES1]
MRIGSDGRININTGGSDISVNSGTNDGLTIYDTGSPSAGVIQTSTNGGPAMYLRRRTNDGSIIVFFRDTTSVGTISVSTTATFYNTSSDYRLKENVVPLANAVDRLNQLQVHRFNFIADPDTTVDGFLAHEAQDVVPECVTGTKDEVDDEGNPVYQGIDQSKIVPLLTAALQEALAKIEALEQRLADAGL